MIQSDPSQQDIRQWAEELEALAYNNARAMKSLSPHEMHKRVERAMKIAEMVYVLWQEGEALYIHCIKGAGTPEGKMTEMTAIWVRSEADALAMKHEWGDGPATLN
jgi:hypothetical protein